VILVGLTGGIGSGKSTVAGMLADRGAVVFDADDLARRAIAPGTPAFERVVERFGGDVLSPHGDLDRDRLAHLVFADDGARRDLEAIVHPEVFRLLGEGVDRYRDTGRVVVFDAPLIFETGFSEACDVVVVVAAPQDQQLARVARDRGMTGEQAEARIRAQMPLQEKRRLADVVIDNDGSLDELDRKVGELWDDLARRAASAAPL
jgi:dephospho-CoA kinase